MADDENGLSRLHPAIAPRVNPNPLQVPGGDEKLRRVTIGGPDEPGDRSFHIDTKTLQVLLDVARSTPAGQVIIPRCGIQVDLYRKPNGHQYEVWTVTGGTPRPAPVPSFLKGLT